MRNLSLASRNRSLFNKLLNLRYVASRLASYNCSRRAKYCFGCSFIALLLAGSFIAGNLQAQEKRETGWFVGTTPWSSPIQLEITQGSALASFTDKTDSIRSETTIDEITTIGAGASVSTEYEVELDESTIAKTEKTENGTVVGDAAAADIAYFKDIVAEICRKEVVGTVGEDNFATIPESAHPNLYWAFRTGDTGNIATTEGCLLPEVNSVASIDTASLETSSSTTTQHSSSSRAITPTGAGITKVNKNLTGSSVHFGYNFEKFRVTFSDSRWNSGENKVQTQMVFADWFLPRDFYAGVGIANSSLATLGASDSSIKPVITFGKSRRLSQRFAIEIGFLYQQIELSVSNNQLSNLSFEDPSTGTEIAGAQRTSKPSTERGSVEFRTTFKEAQEAYKNATVTSVPVSSSAVIYSLATTSSPITFSEIEVRPTRVITVAGDVEQNNHHQRARFYHNYHNRRNRNSRPKRS